jgi:type II secretory pathway component GspD/PulD (secretin)
MRCLLAALILLVMGVGFSNAQAKFGEPVKPEQPEWKGDKEFIFRGVTTDIPLSDLILVTCEYTGIVIVYDPKKVSGDVTLVASRDGFHVNQEGMMMLLANFLEEFRLVLVPKGDVWTIVPGVEAVTYVPTLTEEELASAHPAHWAIVHVPLEHVDPNSATGALRNFTTRQGGMVNPVAPRSLVLCDRVDRLRHLVKLANAMDDAASSSVVSYKLPDGVSAEVAVHSLNQLFPPRPGPASHIAEGPDGKSVIARADKTNQAEIADAVKAMVPSKE